MSQREREAAVFACGDCEVMSFGVIAVGALTPAEVKAQGYVCMSEHAAFMKPCTKHQEARPT